MSKYAQFFAICKVHGLEYKDVVYEYTEGRTDSLRSLSELEYTIMMKRLIDLNEPFRKGFVPKPGDKQRKKMIALALLMRWGKGNIKAVIIELNRWCKKQKFKKALMQHNEPELDLLVAIFELRVYPDYLIALNK